MGEVKDLSSLGIDFQYRLILQIITNEVFARGILPVIKSDYFKDENLKLVIATVKDTFEKDDIIIDLIGIESRILAKISDEIKRAIFIKTLLKIKNAGLADGDYVQEMSIKFCKLKELSKAVEEIKKIINKGDIDNIDDCEIIIKKAIEIGNSEDEETVDAFNNDGIDDLLSEDYRDPIPTGIDKLDEYMNGGLSKPEFGLVIAPTGVGKAQPLTSKILTPLGYKLMGDVKVGDEVINSLGDVSKIEGVYPQKGLRKVVKLTFSDYTEVECDLEHIWTVYNDKSEKINILTKDLISSYFNNETKVSLPLNPIDIQYEKQINLYLPYMVGSMSSMLLGHSDFKMEDFDFMNNLNEIIKEFRETFNLTENEITNEDILESILMSVCTNSQMIEERIPKEYLFSNLHNRKELARGIIDSNGIITENQDLDLMVLGEGKKEDVITLFKSLAFNIKSVNEIVDGNMIIKLTKSSRTPRIESLINGWDELIVEDIDVTLVSYEFKEPCKMQCIKVSAKDSLYITDGFNLTHNTTILTKIANTAKKNNKNVLQLFFEDSVKDIKRKHLACSSGVEMSELHLNKELIKSVNDEMVNTGGILKLHKFKGNTTINTIRNYIKRLRAKGFKPDLIILDYLECIQPSVRSNDSNSDEGVIARDFENLLDEFNCCGWAATQSNRSGVSSDIVTADKVGGSFKKVQIAHFVISIAKTLEQREQDKANMGILKSRIGPDGIIMNDVIFNNKKVEIIVSEENDGDTFFNNNKNKEKKKQQHISEIMDELQNKRRREKIEN